MSRGVLEPASPHLQSEPAIVAGIARATLPRQDDRRLGRPDRQLRPHPRAHRARRSGVRRSTTSASASRAASISPTRRTRATSTRRRSGPASPCTRSPSIGSTDDQLLFMTHAQPRPVQHDDLQRERPLSRHLQRPPSRLPQHRRHRSARSGKGSVGRFDQPLRVGNAGGPSASKSSPTKFPVGCAAAYYPETNVLVADPRHGRRQQSAGFEVDRHHDRTDANSRPTAIERSKRSLATRRAGTAG